MKRLLPIVPLLLACTAQAGDFADLPATGLVTRLVDDHPAVQAGRAGLGAEAANRDRLIAGPHEFNLRLEAARRREVPAGASYLEQALGLERTLRLPGKAAADRAVGDAALEEARLVLGDIRHETLRRLLKGWFDHQRALAARAEWQRQVELLQRQLAVARKRVAEGDAARLEVLQAEAQLAQAEDQWAQTELRARLAAADLAAEFPGLVPAEMPLPGVPAGLEGSDDVWLDKLLAHHHGRLRAQANSRRQQLLARRSSSEELPDPTLGVRYGRERDGQERLLGLQLSIPLPGAARAAASRAALADADAAAAREAQANALAWAEARRSVAQVRADLAQWQRQQAVADRLEENVRLLDKAWRLGEGQFSELQLARRQAGEARLAAIQAQLDSNESRYRLLLDAHELWAKDEGAERSPGAS